MVLRKIVAVIHAQKLKKLTMRKTGDMEVSHNVVSAPNSWVTQIFS